MYPQWTVEAQKGNLYSEKPCSQCKTPTPGRLLSLADTPPSRGTLIQKTPMCERRAALGRNGGVMDGCKVVQLIECTIRRRGKGTEDSLIRVVREYYTLDGQKVAEVDPVNQFEDGTVKAEGE